MGKFQVALLLCVVAFASIAWSQRNDATVSGTVTDPSGAHVVGATVTAQNLETGAVAPVQTNEAGVYNMPPLQPGRYTFTAERTGFRRAVLNDVVLEVGAVLTLNMALELGSTTETVEVHGAAVEVSATSASVGNVVDGKRLVDLPLNGRSAYDLILTQPGVQEGTGFYLNGNQGGAVNFTMDGITAMDNLHNTAFYLYSNVVSVDRAEEFRVVTSPADAEYGRGTGQVQMITRGGTNKFSGAVFWEVRNAVFNANNFFNNLQGRDANGHEVAPRSQLKQNNYGVRFGGPVKKNKMFFNGIYEPYKQRNFTTVNQTVFTAPALQGNFRFFPGVQNGNAQAAIPTVDRNGNPVMPATATGGLVTVNVLGRDPLHLVPDTTGVIKHTLGYVPLPNNFLVGDGLNTAGFTWNRPVPVNFELYEGRIDYVFDEKERLSMTLNHQSYHSFNVATPPPFPGVPGQADPTETTQYSAALTSMIRANLLNEARMGIFRTRTVVQTPYDPDTPGSSGYLPNVSGTTTLISLPSTLTQVYGSSSTNFGIPGNYLNPTYQYGDNLTWIKGRHSFKGGVQVRYISLAGFDFSAPTLPIVGIGSPAIAPITNISTGSNPIAGIGQNAAGATNLLAMLSGATTGAQQLNLSPGGKDPQFVVGSQPYHSFHQNEFDWFFKDDFKVTPSLTLNLGIRWELYLPPVEVQGRGVAPVGDAAGLFGISGKNFGALFNPNATGGSQTILQEIGPGTANPDAQFYRTDLNNFAPALGLAWAVPGTGFWKKISGGPDRMSVRIGYGIGYQRLPLGVVNTVSGGEPGLSETDIAVATDLTNIKLPIQPVGKPLTPIPIAGAGSHTQTVYAYDGNLRTPYTQNYNFTIAREMPGSVALEVAYVGSKSTKLVRTVDTNEVNIFENGLLNAFNIVAAGGDSALIDQIFAPLIGTAFKTGSDYVRGNTNTQGFVANNNPGGLANFINSSTTFGGIAGNLITAAKLPQNFIVANPQFLHTYMVGNFGNSTYNSLQVQVSRRFSHGFSVQSSYVWSHNLGDSEGDVSAATAAAGTIDSYRTLRNLSLDKRPLSFDYQSVFKANGLYELPFGRGKMIGRNAGGILNRFIGGWQLGAIAMMYSGQPITIRAQNAINNTSPGSNTFDPFTANILGALPGDGVSKTGNGVVYFPGLTQVTDPSVGNLTATLKPFSTLKAIAGPSGSLLFVNPLPGQMGALAPGVLRGPGAKQINLNVYKRIPITERVAFQIGATAENLTNTPIFANPNNNIDDTQFGRITGTAGFNPSRLIVLQGRITF